MPAPKPFAAVATPSSNQLARLFAHRHCHLHRAFGRVGTWHRIVEEHHDPIARELIERSFELGDERPQRTMIFAQKGADFLRFGSFGEGGVATQVAKYDDNLLAVAFEDFFVPVRDDQLSKLRREEPLQPPDAS
jgi:hypothetical protein